MTKDELKAKYGRIANDPSQLQMFKDDVIDGEIGGSLPDVPTEAGTYVLTSEDGVISWTEGSGPAPSEPVAKGDTILIAGKAYLVLEANAENTLVKLMPLNEYLPQAMKWYDSSIQTIDFITEDSSATYSGVKYEGSNLDQACSAWIETLDSSLQDALVEAEFVQEMCDRTGDNEPYRFEKIAHAQTSIMRKAHVISVSEMQSMLSNDVKYLKKPGPQANALNAGWTSSAQKTDYVGAATYFDTSLEEYNFSISNNKLHAARPVINVNLTLVDYLK